MTDAKSVHTVSGTNDSKSARQSEEPSIFYQLVHDPSLSQANIFAHAAPLVVFACLLVGSVFIPRHPEWVERAFVSLASHAGTTHTPLPQQVNRFISKLLSKNLSPPNLDSSDWVIIAALVFIAIGLVLVVLRIVIWVVVITAEMVISGDMDGDMVFDNAHGLQSNKKKNNDVE